MAGAGDDFGTRLKSELVHRQPGSEEDTMGKLIVTEFVTLDGVAQAPGGPDEDDDGGGFTHGGWQAPLMDQEGGDNVFEQAKSMDALLLGRRTYEIFANYWPTAPEEIPFTSLLNGVPKYVASRTLAGPLDRRGSTVVSESIAEGVTSLKERHDEVQVIGSLNLVQSLLRFGLVDRAVPGSAGQRQAGVRQRDRAHRAAADRIGHLSQWRAAAHLRHRRNAHIRPNRLAGADERMRPTRQKLRARP